LAGGGHGPDQTRFHPISGLPGRRYARARATGQRFPKIFQDFGGANPGGPPPRFHPVSAEVARATLVRHGAAIVATSAPSGRPTAPGSSSSTLARTTSTSIWERAANDVVGVPRSEAGRNPYDRALSDLVGELSTQSNEFRTRWAAHNVRFHITGIKRFHHPVVGNLSLTYDRMTSRPTRA
jgi:hypothetical protein